MQSEPRRIYEQAVFWVLVAAALFTAGGFLIGQTADLWSDVGRASFAAGALCLLGGVALYLEAHGKMVRAFAWVGARWRSIAIRSPVTFRSPLRNPIIWRDFLTKRTDPLYLLVAAYGEPNGWADVRGVVGTFIRDDQFPFVVNNDTLVGGNSNDPSPGNAKSLCVVLRIGETAEPIIRWFHEHQQVDGLPF